MKHTKGDVKEEVDKLKIVMHDGIVFLYGCLQGTIIDHSSRL